MKNIKKLPEKVINKIAAGEVVESPVSVIKELVENALDAEATHIVVEAEEGGLKKIVVTDNGSGISPEFLEEALERHSTSKILSEADLENLQTMGFRGEALSSISAISHFSLQTSTNETGLGEGIEMQGETLVRRYQLAKTRGTKITVSDLFFNTPARKAFQKKPAYLRTKILRLIYGFSLAFPEKTFSLYLDKKNVLASVDRPFSSFKEQFFFRAKKVFGEKFVSSASWIDHQQGPYRIRGLLGSSNEAKAHKLYQHLFINRRIIKSPFLSSLLKETYGTRIREKDHPCFALHFDLDPKVVDVNVHPQKQEVRFQNPSSIKTQMLKAVEPEKSSSSFSIKSAVFQRPHLTLSEEPLFEVQEEETEELFSEIRTPFRFLIKMGSYFLVERGGLIWVMDGKEALFEQMLIGIKQKKLESQKLLVPYVFEISIDLEERVELLRPFFSEKGIEIRAMRRSVCIDSLPQSLEPEEAKEWVLALLETDIPEVDGVDILRRNSEKVLKRVLGRKTFTESEARALAAEFFEPKAPIFVQLDEEDLRKIVKGKRL